MGIEVKEEGKYEGKRLSLIEPLFAKHAAYTPLRQETQWQQKDVTGIRNFFIESAPFVHYKLRDSYFEHILLSSIYAKKLTQLINPSDLDPNEAEVLNLLHDLGRLSAPSEYYRNDILESLMVRESKPPVRKEIFEKIPSVGRILGIKKPVINNLEDLTLPQMILHVADNLGRFKNSEELFSIKDILSLNPSNTYEQHGWSSERVALTALQQKQDWGNKLVIEEIKLLKTKYGINFNRLRREVLDEFNNYENQKWLFEVKETMEPLDLKVDEKLGRPAIKTVIFDVGGVLFKDSESQMAKAIAKQTGVDFEKVKKAMEDLNTPDIYSGITPESLYLEKFCKTIGREDLPLEEEKNLFIHPEIYEPIEGMQELVKRLSANKKLDIWIFSDSTLSVASPVRQWLKDNYPEIQDGHILISAEVGGSKRDPNGSGIGILLKRAGVTDPQSVLEIDDKPKYTEEFRSLYNTRAITFRDNPFSITEKTAAERLKMQFEKAKLI